MIEVIENNTEIEIIQYFNTVEKTTNNSIVEIADANNTTVDIIQTDNTVLVSNDTKELSINNNAVEIITVGIQGPAGIPEDEMTYSKQIDFIDDNHIYIGEAVPGASSYSTVWRIKYIIISNDGDVSSTWANGNADFTNVWDNRVGYTYS